MRQGQITKYIGRGNTVYYMLLVKLITIMEIVDNYHAASRRISILVLKGRWISCSHKRRNVQPRAGKLSTCTLKERSRTHFFDQGKFSLQAAKDLDLIFIFESPLTL